MKPERNTRRMPAQSQEHSRTPASKYATKARRNARRAKQSAREAR